MQRVGGQVPDCGVVVDSCLNAFRPRRVLAIPAVYEGGDGVVLHGLDVVPRKEVRVQRRFVVTGAAGSNDEAAATVIAGQLCYSPNYREPVALRDFIQCVETDQTTAFIQCAHEEFVGHRELQFTFGKLTGALGDESQIFLGVILTESEE